MERLKRFPTALVVTIKKPFYMVRHEEEVWEFKPPLRYIITSDHLPLFEDYIEAVSPIESCSFYKPLRVGSNLVGKKIYVERHRDRGIGDLLFMTGALNYIQHVTSNSAEIYFYTLSDRGHVLFNHPTLAGRMPYYGPTLVDSLRAYDYHWILPNVSEVNEEQDQLNVYDAIFRSIGLNPEDIEPRFKRPTISLDAKDDANLDSLFYFIFNDHKIDLRRTPYYVVAPFCYSELRSMPYMKWLEIIRALSDQRPVIVLGSLKSRLPAPDMTAADFIANLDSIKGTNPIINLVGDIPLRLTMSIVSNARCLFSLDSGPLYIAQAARIPAISMWGNSHPGIRLGYDKEYMDLAVWNRRACNYSPCFSYDKFPVHKCPRHEAQRACEVLASVDTNQVLEYLEKVEQSMPRTVSLK